MGKRNIEKHIKYNVEDWKIVSEKAADLDKRVGTFIREISFLGVIKNNDMKQFNSLLTSFNRVGCKLRQFLKTAKS